MRPITFFVFRGGLCLALALLSLAGCSSNQADSQKPTQAEVDSFTGKNIPPEWKGWKPGMPMPKSAGNTASTAQTTSESAPQEK